LKQTDISKVINGSAPGLKEKVPSLVLPSMSMNLVQNQNSVITLVYLSEEKYSDLFQFDFSRK